MKVLTSVKQMKKYVAAVKAKGKTIGLVPTMGYLHEGHLSLLRQAKKDTDCPVMSIFVNPAQFGPKEDFRRYPRDLKRDERMARSAGCQAVFCPPAKEMYPANYSTWVEVEKLSDVLCGVSRPGHFRGVATVVLKLLNIVQPDVAYFGRKDAQQAILIKRMAADLNVNSKIKVMPIVREPDGLAMSSRNVYLRPEERDDALVLRRALLKAEHMIQLKERNAGKIIRAMRSLIREKRTARIDYIRAVDTVSLRPVKKISGEVLIALAVRIGKTRLIDNVIVRERKDKGGFALIDDF